MLLGLNICSTTTELVTKTAPRQRLCSTCRARSNQPGCVSLHETRCKDPPGTHIIGDEPKDVVAILRNEHLAGELRGRGRGVQTCWLGSRL